jgi:hypothetical protein
MKGVIGLMGFHIDVDGELLLSTEVSLPRTNAKV